MSLDVLATSGAPEAILLELLGLTKAQDTYSLPEELATEPTYFSVYLVAPTTVTKFTNCVLTTNDFFCGKSQSLIFKVSFDFTSVEKDAELPTPASTISQGSSDSETRAVSLVLGGDTLPGTQSASISFQQSIDWREGRSLFDIGNIYHYKKAVISDMPVNVVLTVYTKTDYPIPKYQKDVNLIVHYGNIQLIITDAIASLRDVVGDVFSTQIDITLQEHSSVIVEYGAI
jgi:hypothetical protein